MFQTIRLKFSEEGEFRKILHHKSPSSKCNSHSNSNFITKSKPSPGSNILLTVVLTLVLISPHCSAYSITSSHGPSYEYEPFNPSTQLTRVPTTDSPSPSSRVYYTSSSSQSEYPLFFSANSDNNKNSNSDSNSGTSQYVYTPNSNNNNNNNYYGGDSSQYTATQRQIASRILFESRATTPKPLLGFRSYTSSYRNRNYWVKKNQGNQYDSSPYSFLPNIGTNINAGGSSSFKTSGIGTSFVPSIQYDDNNRNNHGPRPQIVFNGDSPRLFPSQTRSTVSTLVRDDGVAVKDKERIVPPWNVLIPAEDPSSPSSSVTTPESKTAPATVPLSSSSSVTERPSSTQQMQGDGSFYSTTLTGSESNNHYQFNNKNEQWFGTVEVVKRPVQILPPPSSSSPSSSTNQNGFGHQPELNKSISNTQNPNNKSNSKGGDESESSRQYTDGESDVEDYGFDGDEYSELDTVNQSFTEGKGLEEDKEEPILFPATVRPTQRTYKIPGNVFEDSELAGLKNILELRSGEESAETYNLKNGTKVKKPSIIFPKETFIPIQEGAKEPPCARKLGYCDTFDGYPKDLLNNVLTNSISSDIFQKVFGDTVGSPKESDVLDHRDDVVLAGRNGLTQETPLCTSQEVTIYPRVARNKDDKWMFIVNHDDYVQGVKVEKCMKEGSSCLFSEGNPLGYESVCRQKFILRKLVALNGDGKTALDTFKLPSCCVCYIKSNFVSERIGSLSSASSASSSSASGSGSNTAHLSDTDSMSSMSDRPSHPHIDNEDAQDGIDTDTVDGQPSHFIPSSTSKDSSNSNYNSSLSTPSYSTPLLPSSPSSFNTTRTTYYNNNNSSSSTVSISQTTPETILSRSKNSTLNTNRTLSTTTTQ